MKSYIFEGIPSGDHECFTFAVDKKTFKLLMGNDPGKYDKSSFHKGLYNFYLDKILTSIEDPKDYSKEETKIKVHITIDVV